MITSDDVCCNTRNFKFIKVMQFKQMFVTAVCLSFLLKLEVYTQATVKTTITHNNFRLCRVSFSTFVRQPFSKQLYP